MGAIDLDAVMEAIATELKNDGVTKRAYGYPAEEVEVPCAVVGYPLPGTLRFDMTFGRGADQATFPVWFLVGRVSTRAARKALADIIAGATGIKDALDGNLGGTVQTARVTECTVETVAIGSVSFLSARFDVEVAT